MEQARPIMDRVMVADIPTITAGITIVVMAAATILTITAAVITLTIMETAMETVATAAIPTITMVAIDPMESRNGMLFVYVLYFVLNQ